MDITELKAIIDANIFENTSQAITGDALNDVLNLIADSLGEYVPAADIFDEAGTIRSALLPSYVDDVLEFSTRDAFPAVGEGGKIYLATDTNLSYRWGGSEYVIIAQSLALGETSSTAYRGDRGKIAYDHSQTSHRLSIAGLEVSALGGSIEADALASALSIPELRNAVAVHIGDGSIHITADERAVWNKIASLFGIDDSGDIYIKNDENGRARGFYTYSFLSAGGKGESSSGGGSTDYTQWGWDDIIQLTSDPGLGNLASAWALKQEYDSRQSALSVLSQGLSSIRLLIPSSASESNQLADKEFVNSSIASNTATFRGTFEGVSYLPSGAKLNDYAFVIATDASGNPEYNRYKYTASGWVFEYTLNNSSFTAEQWSAITSGITANLVSLYSGHIANKSNPHAVTKAQIGLGDVENIKLSSWAGSTNITTLGAVTTGEWKASRIANDYLVNSSIQIGSTTVSLGEAIEALSGIASISLKGDNDAKLTYDNGAWHLSGNLLVDGYITAGGVGSSSGSGGIDSEAMWALLGDATNEQINKTHISAALEGYQTIIPGLDTIRNNADNGNTAYGYFTNGRLPYTSVSGTPDLSDMATKTWVNVQGYLKGITSSMVTSALGYTPYNASNPNGYISGISKAMVENVLTGNITSHKHSVLVNDSGNTSSRFLFHASGDATGEVGNMDADGAWGHPTNSQDSHYGNAFIARLKWSDYYYSDIFTGPNNAGTTYGLQWRQIVNSKADNWRILLDTANFNTYAPTLTGAGASGTWGININGNAATATNANTLGGYGVNQIAGQADYTTWQKTTTSGTAWFPICSISDVLQGSVLCIVKGYAHSSVIFTVTKGYSNAYINILAGGGDYNVNYAYVTGVRYINNKIEIGLNAAATRVAMSVKVIAPNVVFSLNSELIEDTSSNSDALAVYTGLNVSDMGIRASTFYGSLSGNATSATQLQTSRTIWGQSFNGTANVSGDMTGVGSITASRNITANGGVSSYNEAGPVLKFQGIYAKSYTYAFYNNSDCGLGLRLLSNASYATPIIFDYLGNVGIGTAPSEKLHVIGNILATGAITAGTASDSRLKNNIATLCNASSVLRQLRGVGFDWNTLATDKSSYFKGHDVGLIAQEVEPLIPSAIGTIWGEYKRLDYTKITPYLVEGWKEHDTEISRLRKRVSELESEVNKLRNYVN